MASGVSSHIGRQAAMGAEVSLEHHIQVLLHRKWLIIIVFLIVTALTVGVAQRLPNQYTSNTVILVDPQKVPEAYVKSTVTGDIRNRLNTLSQQILSATRLQTIINALNLYREEKKKLAREEIIAKMRKDILTSVVSDFGANQDLQAFRISYTGRDARLVAQVTNELASLFIEENWKAREKQAEGTTEFLSNQLQETRKTLEDHEAKLKDYRLKHIGEMPEQQTATLQILGQLQAQLQSEGDALGRAEQQKTLVQSMMSQSTPVVDLDAGADADASEVKSPTATPKAAAVPKPSVITADKAKLAELLTHYKETYPDVVKLKKKIENEEAKQTVLSAVINPVTAPVTPALPVPPDPPSQRLQPAPPSHFNPVLQAQLESMDAEIAKHKQEQERLAKMVASYQSRLEAIPVREQEIVQLSRDYEMSKVHYSQLLDKQLSAETATQLEMRQKGEKFVILDPALPAEKPSSPNRLIIDAVGAVCGLVFGLLLAIVPEFFGASLIAAQDLATATNLPVLEVIPVIQTRHDHLVQKRRILVGAASAVIATVGCCAVLFYHFRGPQ